MLLVKKIKKTTLNFKVSVLPLYSVPKHTGKTHRNEGKWTAVTEILSNNGNRFTRNYNPDSINCAALGLIALKDKRVV